MNNWRREKGPPSRAGLGLRDLGHLLSHSRWHGLCTRGRNVGGKEKLETEDWEADQGEQNSWLLTVGLPDCRSPCDPPSLSPPCGGHSFLEAGPRSLTQGVVSSSSATMTHPSSCLPYVSGSEQRSPRSLHIIAVQKRLISVSLSPPTLSGTKRLRHTWIPFTRDAFYTTMRFPPRGNFMQSLLHKIQRYFQVEETDGNTK